MAHLDSEYWTLGQVTAWCCTRNEKDVAIVAGRDSLGLEILLNMQGVLAETPEDCPNLLLQNMRIGRIVATARLAHDTLRHPVPKEHWKLLTLSSGCADTNAPCKPTRDELCLSWRSSFKNREGCDYSGSELPHSEISSINDAVKKISKLPDWLDLAFSPSEIKALFPPCREDEPWWDLQETIGFITHGYPLIARWRNGETGEKMFRESLEQLRKKLQGGEIACKKQFYDPSARSSEGWAQLPWSDVTENELMNFELLFDDTLLNALSLNGTPYQVKFKAADVRALWPQGKTQESSVSTAITAPCKAYLRKNLDNWYEDYVKQCVSTDVKPSREQDCEAIKKKFPNISREAARDLRRRLAPDEWRGRGRRKSAK